MSIMTIQPDRFAAYSVGGATEPLDSFMKTLADSRKPSSTFDWDLDAERDLWRSICAPNSWFDEKGNVGTHPYSLWNFVTKAWGAASYLKSHPSEPQWLYEPIHIPYTQWLQKHILDWKRKSLSGKPGRTHIASVLPRGYGKTVCSTKSATLWSGLDDPDMTCLIQSATEDFSVDILKAQKAVMSGQDEDSWFVWLYGNWEGEAKDWTKKYVNHAYRRARNISEPSLDMSSSAVGSTGYHPRQCWWDDPLIKNKLKQDKVAYLRGQKEAVNASFNSVHTNGLIALTLTRYLDNDIAGDHFRTEGVATWEGMPCPHMAIFDEVPFGEGIWHVFYYQTEDEATGAPTNPRLWDRSMIAAAKKRDSEDFACQQQNNPGSGEHAPLVESQIPWLYMSYEDFNWEVTPQWATVHIDTAFKNKENAGDGDYNAIVVWIKSTRDDGRLYLDTNLLRASNEWREEDFNRELVKVCLQLRKRGIFIRNITDEKEPGGKEGTYKNRILGILRTAGFMLSDDQFIQFNRDSNKKARIRTAVGHWAEGYVRIVLNRDRCDCLPLEYDPIKHSYIPRQCPHFMVPSVVKTLIDQIVRVDVVGHDDLADAMTDGFTRQCGWTPPAIHPGSPQDEGSMPRRPWDNDLKDVGKPMSYEELNQFLTDRDELAGQGMMSPGHGWDDDGWISPMEPV
jgi:hypothetical protein